MVTKPSVRHPSAENLLRVIKSESLDQPEKEKNTSQVYGVPAAASRSVPQSNFEPGIRNTQKTSVLGWF